MTMVQYDRSERELSRQIQRLQEITAGGEKRAQVYYVVGWRERERKGWRKL